MMLYRCTLAALMLYRCTLAAAAFIGSHYIDRLDNNHNHNIYNEFRRFPVLAARRKASPSDERPRKPSTKLTKTEKKKAEYLKKALSLNNKELDKLIAWFPSSVGYSSEDNVAPTLQYLKEKLLLDDKELSKLVRKFPQVLGCSIGKNLEPTLDYLQKRLLLDDKELSKLVRRYPSVLGFSIEENLEPKLDYLQTRLLLDEDELRKLVRRLPQVFSCSIEENLVPKLDYFRKRLRLDEEELSKLVQKMPQVLKCNVDDNLDPTIEFFEGLLGVDKAKSLITKDPSFLSRSLENRLKPRLEQVREAGLPLEVGTLSRMAKYTEEKWATSMAYQKNRLVVSKGGLW